MPASFLNEYDSFAISGIGLLTPSENSQTINIDNFRETIFFNKWDKFRQVNDDAKLMLIATKLALEDGGINLEAFDKDKVGIVFIASFGSFLSYESFEESILKNNLQPQAFSNSLASSVTAAVSIFWGIKGPCITVSSAGNSELDVIIFAKKLLEEQVCNFFLIGGWLKFSKTCLSYFARKNNISEIALVAVMESVKHVENRGHVPYTIVKMESIHRNELNYISFNTNGSKFCGKIILSTPQNATKIKFLLFQKKTVCISTLLLLAEGIKVAFNENIENFLVVPLPIKEGIGFRCKRVVKK